MIPLHHLNMLVIELVIPHGYLISPLLQVLLVCLVVLDKLLDLHEELLALGALVVARLESSRPVVKLVVVASIFVLVEDVF